MNNQPSLPTPEQWEPVYHMLKEAAKRLGIYQI